LSAHLRGPIRRIGPRARSLFDVLEQFDHDDPVEQKSRQSLNPSPSTTVDHATGD
jgi:hypothetical protein